MKTLIADSGSTKCTWLVADGAQTVELHTRGINAVLHTPAQIREVLAELPGCGRVDRVCFYGAGCGPSFPQATATLIAALETHLGVSDICVQSDLTGAARALFGRDEGIACILGTGSNSCRCRDGEVVQNVPPLGYILGDEGSGAALGRALLNGVFKGHIPLREELLSACGLTYEELIRRVYREPFANRFLASFAPFVREHLACEEVEALVRRAFGEFAERNLTRYELGPAVSFVGGVAWNFREILTETIEKYGFRVGAVVESPAASLLKYHGGA